MVRDLRLTTFDAILVRDKEIRRKAVEVMEGTLFAVDYAARAGIRTIIFARRTNATEPGVYGPVQPRPEQSP